MPNLLKTIGNANSAIEKLDGAARALRSYLVRLDQVIIKTVMDPLAAGARLLLFRLSRLVILGSLVGIIIYGYISHINKAASRSSTTSTSSETSSQVVATLTESARGSR